MDVSSSGGGGDGGVPIPAEYVATNAALLDWVLTLALHGPTHAFCEMTYLYLAVEVLCYLLGGYLFLRVFVQGRFWLFRRVHAPRGKLLVFNNADLAAVLAMGHIIMDTSFRAMTVAWWCYDRYTDSLLLFLVIRYLPAIGMVWACVSANALIWPFSPMDVNPRMWNFALVAAPVLAIVLLVPPSAYITVQFQSVARLSTDLIAGMRTLPPRDPPSASLLQRVSVLSKHLHNEAYALRSLTIAAVVMLVPLTIVQTVIYVKLLRRLGAAIGQLSYLEAHQGDQNLATNRAAPSKPRSHSTASSGSTTDDTTTTTTSPPPPPQRRRRGDVSLTHRLLYTLGARPLLPPETDDDRLPSAVPLSEAVRVLRRFRRHFVLENTCLALLCTTCLALCWWTCVDAPRSLVTRGPNPFIFPYAGLMYVFTITETWAFLLFGIPYVLSVLYRQAFPIGVNVRAQLKRSERARAVVTSPSVRITREVVAERSDNDVIPALAGNAAGASYMGEESVDAKYAGLIARAQLRKSRGAVCGSAPARRGSTAAADDLGGEAGRVEQLAGGGVEELRSEAATSSCRGASGTPMDALNVVGTGVGRSLVLEALVDSDGSRVARWLSGGGGGSSIMSSDSRAYLTGANNTHYASSNEASDTVDGSTACPPSWDRSPAYAMWSRPLEVGFDGGGAVAVEEQMYGVGGIDPSASPSATAHMPCPPPPLTRPPRRDCEGSDATDAKSPPCRASVASVRSQAMAAATSTNSSASPSSETRRSPADSTRAVPSPPPPARLRGTATGGPSSSSSPSPARTPSYVA